MKWLAVLLGVILVLGAVWLYGRWQAQQAVLQRQADSLTAALADVRTEIVGREAVQRALAQQVEDWRGQYQDLSREVTRLRIANHASIDSLRGVLSGLPTSTSAPIIATIHGLQQEAAVCSSALVKCDSIQTAQGRAIASRDTTIAAQDSLLGVYEQRLAAAVAASKVTWRPKLAVPAAAILSGLLVALLLSQ